MTDAKEYPCDICGSGDGREIACAPHYTAGQLIHVCGNCGFVYVKYRRDPRDIASDWSDRLFNEEGAFTNTTYSARIPAIVARQTFVADTIDTELGLDGKRLCDIGAGEGQFLRIVRDQYGGKVYGIEPSRALCDQMARDGFENYCGAIEDYRDAGGTGTRNFDIVTMMWTLECSSDPRGMIAAARESLSDRGHVVVSTGSRILVPFRKPLQFYFDPKPLDTHCLRFSANTLPGLLTQCGFRITFINRYIDQDWLLVIAEKDDSVDLNNWTGDDPDAVLDFFERWHQETQAHYADYVDE